MIDWEAQFDNQLSMGEISTYKLGDFELKSAEVLEDAFIAYRTFGDPKSPAIVYPTWYSGSKDPESEATSLPSSVVCKKSPRLTMPQRSQIISGSLETR